MKRWIITAGLLLSCSLQSHAVQLSLNEGWKFIQQDVAGGESLSFSDSAWRTLDVPHDWSIEGEYDASNPMADACGYLPAGIGWYRKTIPVKPEWKGKYVEIAFDGVCMNSTVWANGRKLGDRPYGWSSFAYDISDLVDSANSITFAVRVDNEKQPSARWYTGSGIYANTWLNIKDKVHVARGGIFFRTLEVDEAKATVQVSTEVVGDPRAEVSHQLFSKDGKKVAEGFQTLEIEQPKLWSVENPNLYTLRTLVKSGGRVVDQVDTRVGIRVVEWKAETGFWLNGKNVKLRGVCNHQDAGPLGAAVPEKIIRYRLEQMKAMGCNAIRTAHNPMTPEFYDMCDELGLLVMDEIFDGWYQKAEHDYGAHAFAEWWDRDLTDWILRDRNHPSIIIWSVGNETKGEEMGRKLVERCHELDPTRLVTSGHSAHEVMDVFGANGGSEKLGFFDTLETDQPFVGTENTHTFQVRGYYRTKTWYRNGYPSTRHNPHYYPDLTDEEVFTYDWIDEADRAHPKHIFFSSYDNATVRLTSRHNVEMIRDIPRFAGSFRWCGYDYLGEAKYHGGWPFKSFSGGAVDLANFEKDLYYMYQSQWTEKPMVHILPHWTHPAIKPGTKIPVQVYSNCDEVELFLNGKSLGIQNPGKTHDKMACQWMVGWEPGELKAVARSNGNVKIEKTMQTAGAPAKLALSVDGEPLAENGKDIVQLRVAAQDEQGIFYPYGENRTWFHVIGPGRIRALGNGSPVDIEKHQGVDNRRAFFGLTRAFVEASGENGDIAVLASSILGERKLVYSNRVSIDSKLIALRGKLPATSIEIFYTTDGSEPTEQSSPYKGAFTVQPGTTVKALVVLNGKPVQVLEERFASDVGMVWKSSVQGSSVPAGEQAERAELNGASIVSKGQFRGEGFIKFNGTPGAFVQWYYENDGDSGDGSLVIRYGGVAAKGKGHRIKVMMNGETVSKNLLLPNSDKVGQKWSVVKVPIQVERGANRIRLEPLTEAGLCIDEISIR
ncbi:glycoside hydrolase family 2 TIM barrel-domain containing protein [Pontiella agarivorans]|uniref:Glycoside hydrolase family 2 TIM barrel-domain containing protein n=1 Tax=Pontiella agarivorans TaxID=3038953 RepID=A0ABU5MSJ9_9BACT|nr:glycoside hydrolase family 2 TIM barrel-domain containing protein [Pontiella agarivorans]MDZ8117088.1 glycoside hydrolase family 2 TIM barrel-domain containing protein [Pontiella agarivorans]